MSVSNILPPRAPAKQRGVILLATVLALDSFALLFIASGAREYLPSWGGPADGAIAFALVGTLATLHQRNRRPPDHAALRGSYRVAVWWPTLLFLLLWLARARIDWNTLLPGLAWRSGVILLALPSVLAAWRGTGAEGPEA